MIREFDVALPHGITLACRGAGPGLPRVLLLHGFPEAAFVWDEVMERQAPGMACIAPNLRGYAGSSSPTDVQAYRARHLVSDLAALIESIGAPFELVVAHDWGGALAWSLAAQQPRLLKRLLILNAPHPATFLRELRSSPEQIAASAYMNYLARPDAARRLAEDDWRRLWGFFGDATWLDGPLRQRYRDVWSRGLEGPLNYYRASPLRPAMAGHDGLARVELPDDAVTVTVPTWVLWGERDEALRPGLLDGLQRWVPRLQVQRVPEASHWIVHEQPDRVVAAIEAALATPA